MPITQKEFNAQLDRAERQYARLPEWQKGLLEDALTSRIQPTDKDEQHQADRRADGD